MSQILAFFFSPQGRVNRGEYLLGYGLIFMLSAALFQAILVATAGVIEFSTLATISLIFLPSQIIIAIKRCHDFGLTGIFVLLFMVPIIGLIWLVVLAIIPGNPDANQYGAPIRYGPD